jgi:glycosyltransferase involved in cell wall biosynthesis
VRGTLVFAVPDFEPAVGGTTRQVGLQARALQDRGYDVVVVTRRRDRGWARRETVGRLPVVRLGLAHRGRLAEAHGLLSLALWLTLRRRKVAVLQTVMWPDAWASAALAGLLRRTVVLWAIRGEAAAAIRTGTSRLRRRLGRARRALLRRCVHVTLTPAMAAELEALGNMTPAKVIPVPVDTARFRPPTPAERRDARAALGLDETAFAIVYVGHLEERKAVDRLLEAVALLAQDGAVVALVVVGAGRGLPTDTESELRRRAAEDDLSGLVRFVGVQPEPRPYLWAADALVLPSVREGMPNSLLEAMACGLPCIAPASAGGDELLDAETGIVPPSNDPADLAAALRDLAADSARRRRLGDAARTRVRRFGIDEVADQYDRLYLELVSGGRS